MGFIGLQLGSPAQSEWKVAVAKNNALLSIYGKFLSGHVANVHDIYISGGFNMWGPSEIYHLYKCHELYPRAHVRISLICHSTKKKEEEEDM